MQEESLLKLFTDYQEQLKYLFEHFVKLDLGEIIKANEILMSYKGLIKLANHLRLIPNFLSPDDLTIVYKSIIREKNETDKEEIISALDYDDFLSLIVRLAVILKKKLNFDAETNKSQKEKNTLKIDMNGVNADLIEKMLNYLGLERGEKKLALAQKLNNIKQEYSKVPTFKPRQTLQESEGKYIF